MKPQDNCSFIVIFFYFLGRVGSFEDTHLAADGRSDASRLKRFIIIGNFYQPTETPVYIRPLGSITYTPCITCTNTNQVACCQFYQRCCPITATNPAFKAGTCPTQISVTYCAVRCISDAQCPGATKCCPPAVPVCVTPILGQTCPVNVPPSALLRPCLQGQASCDVNEICCPNPQAQGCCSATTTEPIVNVPQVLQFG